MFLEELALAIGAGLCIRHWAPTTQESAFICHDCWLKYLQESLPVHFVFDSMSIQEVHEANQSVGAPGGGSLANLLRSGQVDGKC